MRLFSWFILRRLLREPLRAATTTLGIALGIAVIVAIQLTNASSVAGFETALDDSVHADSRRAPARLSVRGCCRRGRNAGRNGLGRESVW